MLVAAQSAQMPCDCLFEASRQVMPAPGAFGGTSLSAEARLCARAELISTASHGAQLSRYARARFDISDVNPK